LLKTTALRLAADGWQIAVAGRSFDKLDKTAEANRRAGGEDMPVQAFRQPSPPPRDGKPFSDVGERWGRLDIVFARAGFIWHMGPD
jgi:NAD(P)-dependent dehydrogenase (short-subunit alcohol dehydrogenase family)